MSELADIQLDSSRREMDRFLVQWTESNKERLIEIANRTSRLELLFENLSKEMNSLTDTNAQTSRYIEEIAKNMTSLAHRLHENALAQENQWHVVNRTNTNLERLTEVTNQHFSDAEGIAVRISWHERVIIALTSVFGTLATALLIKAFLN